MVITAIAPLVAGLVALGVVAGCRRPETRALVSGLPVPLLETRLLEARAVGDHPPPTAAGVMTTFSAGDAEARREGGVPESLIVDDDRSGRPDGCKVTAVWWIAHLCGVTAKGAATWIPDKRMAFTTAKLEGMGRTDCPSMVTRFQTVIQGLPDGAYRFGTPRRAVEFAIHCGERRSGSPAGPP